MSVILKCLLIFILFPSYILSKEIKIGMSADFSSSISYLGNNMRVGIQAYLNKVNKTSKYKYKLISYDDKYNPLQASINVRRLIQKDKVVALLGNVGTPTANVVIPILNEHELLLFGAYSGGNVFRDISENKYLFNYRASYAQEAYTIVSNLIKQGIKPNEIAVFTQNDTYGDSGYSGVIKAFREVGITNLNEIAHARYTKDTLNIESGLSKLLDFDVDFKAIVMVSVNKPFVKFINYAKEDFPNVKFFALSPLNSNQLIKNKIKFSKDIFITQVVPTLDENLEIIDEYKKDLKDSFNDIEPNLISFEGYIVAKLFIKSIKGLNKENINSQTILKQLNKFEKLDIGLGFANSFHKRTHQYTNKVWLTTIKDESLKQIKWSEVFMK